MDPVLNHLSNVEDPTDDEEKSYNVEDPNLGATPNHEEPFFYY